MFYPSLFAKHFLMSIFVCIWQIDHEIKTLKKAQRFSYFPSSILFQCLDFWNPAPSAILNISQEMIGNISFIRFSTVHLPFISHLVSEFSASDLLISMIHLRQPQIQRFATGRVSTFSLFCFRHFSFLISLCSLRLRYYLSSDKRDKQTVQRDGASSFSARTDWFSYSLQHLYQQYLYPRFIALLSWNFPASPLLSSLQLICSLWSAQLSHLFLSADPHLCLWYKIFVKKPKIRIFEELW